MIVFHGEAMAELKGDGPLVEYERRIAAGELLDGDACQVSSLFLELSFLVILRLTVVV